MYAKSNEAHKGSNTLSRPARGVHTVQNNNSNQRSVPSTDGGPGSNKRQTDRTGGETEFMNRYVVSGPTIAPRIGSGPNASRGQRAMKYLKTDKDVPKEYKKSTATPKKKSKWEGKITKADILGDIEDIELQHWEDDDDNIFLTYGNAHLPRTRLNPNFFKSSNNNNDSSHDGNVEILETGKVLLPDFDDDKYIKDWWGTTHSELSVRQLFPREMTRRVTLEKASVYTPFKSSYIVSTDTISWKTILNSPVYCGTYTLSRYAPHRIPNYMVTDQVNIFDLLEELPSGYHIWLRTGAYTYHGFSTRATMNVGIIHNSKMLVIENYGSKSHVWLGIKPDFDCQGFNLLQTNCNMLSLPNLVPGLDSTKVKPSIAWRSNASTCAFFGNSYPVIQAMIQEGNNLIQTHDSTKMSWEDLFEPSELEARCPITCAAVGVHLSRHWARLWYGQNPFPEVSDNIQTRMLAYKRLTSDFPSVMPFVPLGEFMDNYKREVPTDIEIKHLTPAFIKGVDGKHEYYITNRFLDLEVPDDVMTIVVNDGEVKIVDECKKLLSEVGLNKKWKGYIFNWNFLGAPQAHDVLDEVPAPDDFEFTLPFYSNCLPTAAIWEKPNKDGKPKRRKQTLFHRGCEGYGGVGTFTFENGKSILGLYYGNTIRVADYYDPKYFNMYPYYDSYMRKYYNVPVQEVLEKTLDYDECDMHNKIQRYVHTVKGLEQDVNLGCMIKSMYIDDDNEAIDFIRKDVDRITAVISRDNNEETCPDWMDEAWRMNNGKVISKLPDPKPRSFSPVAYMKGTASKYKAEDPIKNNGNNDNAHNSSDVDDEEDDQNSEEQVTEKDNLPDFIKENQGIIKGAKATISRQLENTRSKLINMLNEIRTTVADWLSAQGGRIIGWKAKFMSWVDRFIHLLKKLIKNFDKNDIPGTIVGFFSAFLKFIANPSPQNVPDSDIKFNCEFCNAETNNYVAKQIKDEKITFNICDKCLENAEECPCTCGNEQCCKGYGIGWNCFGVLEKRHVRVGYSAYENTKWGFVIKRTCPLDELKLENASDVSRSDALALKEPKEPEKDEPISLPESTTLLPAPDLSLITTVAITPPSLPNTCVSDTVVPGFTPWIRQNWDYSSAAKAGTGLFTRLVRGMRNTLNDLDEDINFKVGDEKTAMFWCYRKKNSTTLTGVERRPTPCRKIKMTVRNPSITIYEVLFGIGKVETAYGTTTIKQIRQRELMVCEEGSSALMITHSKIVNPDSKLDAAFVLSVTNSNCLNDINVTDSIALDTKEFHIIRICERLQKSSVKFISNNNNSASH